MAKKTVLSHGLRAGALALTLSCALVSAEDWELPRELSGKVSALSPEQQRFITGGAILEYMPPKQLEHLLRTRPEEELQTFLDEIIAVAGMMGYDPERDMGAIPLNLTSKHFNRGTIPTPAPLREIERDPGPFSVSRYLFPESGIPTFAGARVAIYPEDLVAGEVDVAIVGVPNDMGSGRRNAEAGPRVMRALDTISTPDTLSLVDPMEALTVVDYGDFHIDNMSTERTINHVTAMVTETAATGAVPMLVGGDTSMLYPGVKGVASAHAGKPIGLVHFSAHPDAERDAVHTISDTQAIFLLLEEGIIDGPNLIQVGLRGEAVTSESLEWLRNKGTRYHTMAEITHRGYDAVLARVLDEVAAGPEQLFMSIDVSVIEPTEMVAAGRIVSDGLRVKEVTSAIRTLCASKDIVGFEITDMAPMLDYSRLSTVNANAVLNACLVGMAVRAEGLAPDYVHPLALDHGGAQ